MFGPRHHRRYGRGGYRRGMGGNFGLLLLGLQLFNFIQYLSSRNEFLPATLVVIGINVLLFLRPDFHIRHRHFSWPSVQGSCISVQSTWYQGQWKRVLLAPFIHGDSWHLYYNMASFIWKSRTLERHFGTAYYAYLTAVFTVLSSFTYLAINYVIAEMFDVWSYVRTCAVGFSGVIFALKVVTTHLEPPGMTNIFGIPVPKRLAVWGELVLISVLFPNASFVGHLSGILVGVAFVSGPLKQIMDLPITLLSGYRMTGGMLTQQRNNNRPSYNYASRPTGTRDNPTATSSRNDYNNNGEDEGLQEAIRRSLRDNDQPSNDSSGYTHPPPYNPHYREEDTAQEEQVGHADGGEEVEEMSMEELREARLRRLNNPTDSRMRRRIT